MRYIEYILIWFCLIIYVQGLGTLNSYYKLYRALMMNAHIHSCSGSFVISKQINNLRISRAAQREKGISNPEWVHTRKRCKN